MLYCNARIRNQIISGIRFPLLIIFLFFFSEPSIAVSESHTDQFNISDFCNTVTVQFDNDLFYDTDEAYTHGTRLACASKEIPSESGLRDFVPFLPGTGKSGTNRLTLALGQNIFTPSDITDEELDVDDRPYAGWLYLSFGLESDIKFLSGVRFLDNLDIQLGIVGPQAYADETQTIIHDIVGAAEPQGWDNQLENEIGLNLFYNRVFGGLISYESADTTLGTFGVDLSPHIGVALGNVFTYGSLGGTVRVGIGLPEDYGPPFIRPSLPGSDSFEKASASWNAYVFAGAEGRAIARNIFLDGNTFEDSHSIDKEYFLGELQLGLALTVERFRVAYTHIIRTPEFSNGPSTEFGSFSLSVRF